MIWLALGLSWLLAIVTIAALFSVVRSLDRLVARQPPRHGLPPGTGSEIR